jgi:hypothetical protein
MKKFAVACLAVVVLGCTESTTPENPMLPATHPALSMITGESSGSVLPSAFISKMGLVNNNFPHSFRPLRYQQVFPGSDIGDPNLIGVCLRRDDASGGAERIQTLTVKLGPTSLDNTNLGRTFDANYSAPPVEMFTGDVVIPAALPGGTPADFDFCIPFTSTYVHQAGTNLIIEVVNTSATSANVPRDACAVGEDGCTTARAYAFSATATEAQVVSQDGLIMKFVSPEPPKPVDPANMDECKKGGWSNFGFRNQGQCIRFVETAQDSRGTEES